MNQFDIIGSLKAYAENQGWAFLSGQDWYQNYEASQNEYANGQLVLGVDFDSIPVRKAGIISEISYPGTLILGRKFDPDTKPSSLDETFIQKYEARLLELTTLLSNMINTFMCEHNLDVLGENIRMDLNKFDTNIDFVVETLTFIQ